MNEDITPQNQAIRTSPSEVGGLDGIEYIDLKECILAGNEGDAQEVRDLLREKNVFLWNIMSSPGSGKTTFITDVIKRFSVNAENAGQSGNAGQPGNAGNAGQSGNTGNAGQSGNAGNAGQPGNAGNAGQPGQSGLPRHPSPIRFGVIEADIESTVDAEKMHALGIPTVQLRTGGGCHLDAAMVMEALTKMPLDDLDVIIVENVGNLVCPAEFDIGATLATMLLSVPEGDDKAIKYPLMFTVTKAVIVTKTDVMPYFDFSLDALERNARRLNNDLRIFPVSVKTGEGMDVVINWLSEHFRHNK